MDFNKYRIENSNGEYLTIPKDEWLAIKSEYPEEEIRKKLAEILLEYPMPTAVISEQDAITAFYKLKSIKWQDHLCEGDWFYRKVGDSDWPITYGDPPRMRYFRRYNVGNAASNYFQQENRWSVEGGNRPGPRRTWETVDGIDSAIRGLFSLKFDKVTRSTIRTSLALRKYIASQFRPGVAKCLYDFFSAKTILDMSAGWGDRLAGFWASEYGTHYVGLDPRVENHPIYKRQIEFYQAHNSEFEPNRMADLFISPAEDFDYSPYEGYFDLAFTSPPYFSVERYSTDDTQSWVRYKDINSWNKDFLHAMLSKVWRSVKPGGRLCINIADVYINGGKNGGYHQIINPMNEFMATLPGAVFEGAIGMEMAARPGSPGAGNLPKRSTHKFSDMTIQRAADSKGKKFAEPIWIWKKDSII